MSARLLVVGASSGIGQALASAAVAAGHRVVGAARRREPIEATGAHSLRCDVRDPGDCAALGPTAAGLLGGLDGVVYAAGIAPLAPVAGTDAAGWRDLLAVNLVGAALVVSAALPHLSDGATVLLLGSDSVPSPKPGLVPYAASKAALATLAAGWRAECPRLRFRCPEVGPTLTAFADRWDPVAATEALLAWERAGYLSGEPARPETVATELLAQCGWAPAADRG